MNPEPPASQTPPPDHPAPLAKRRHIPNLSSILFGLFVVFVLAALMMPGADRTSRMGSQTKAFAQSKQIGLALKLFAGDHDGQYPTRGVPVEMTTAPTTSNAAFAPLLPTYTTSERLFGNPLSAYQTRPPDDVIDTSYTGKPVKTLEPGENVYAYVAGLTDASSPNAPLVLDGTDGTGLYYNSTRAIRGGVWEGKRAIVIYLDNHGSLGTLVGRENTRYIPSHVPGRPANLLDLSWLGPDAHLLDPAVAP